MLRQQFRGKPYAFVDEPRVHISAEFVGTRDLRRTTFLCNDALNIYTRAMRLWTKKAS